MNRQRAVLEIRDLLHLHERRDLDAFIARDLLGWTVVSKASKDRWIGLRPVIGKKLETIPHFHTDMNEMMQVIDHLCSKFPELSILIAKKKEEYKVEWHRSLNDQSNTKEKISEVSNIDAALAIAVSCVEVYKTLVR